MPLFKGCGCKAKPGKAIDYITDEKKAAIVTSYALDDNRDYARQYAETAQLFHKAQRYDSRKYYHFKHSFDPKDNISPEEAHRLTEELAQQVFPDNEYIIATHTDAKLKDLSNEIAAKYGYSTLDFRKPSADRIKSEERRVVLKGGTSWKEELREVIAEALKLCNNMDEFEMHLSKYGVTIARNTAKTISFLHPQKKKPIRGNKLGKAYAKEAIIHEFTESRQDIAVTKKMRESVDKLMMSNELLRQSLGNELGKFSEQMSKQLTTIFVDNYRSFTETTVKAEEKQKAQTENYLSELSNEITLLKLKIKRMYHFNRFKIALLWAGWIAVIILLLMEIIRTFILK